MEFSIPCNVRCRILAMSSSNANGSKFQCVKDSVEHLEAWQILIELRSIARIASTYVCMYGCGVAWCIPPTNIDLIMVGDPRSR